MIQPKRPRCCWGSRRRAQRWLVVAVLGAAAACGPLSRSPVAESPNAGGASNLSSSEGSGTSSSVSSNGGIQPTDGGGGTSQQPTRSTGTGTSTGNGNGNGSGNAGTGTGTGNGGKATTGTGSAAGAGNGTTAPSPSEPTLNPSAGTDPAPAADDCGSLLAALNSERLALCAHSATSSVAKVLAAALPAQRRCALSAEEAAITSCDALPPAANSATCSRDKESCAQTRLRIINLQKVFCEQMGASTDKAAEPAAELRADYQAAAQRLTGCCLDSLVLPSLDACPDGGASPDAGASP